MLQTREGQLGMLLEHVGAALDISDELYRDAVTRYEQVGMHLGQSDSALFQYAPDIYPQGSFRLGTVVRPISDDDEYDIDLVCELQINKSNTTQHNLKNIVGERLRESEAYDQILSESRRCWCLDFDSTFHMDVLPAIPDTEGTGGSILLTDKDLLHWQHSNPIDFAEWFKNRMIVRFNEKQAAIANSIRASVEDVPDWQIRTPLQRSIQILKRHRDIAFIKTPDSAPASIVITTLAAKAYENEADLFEAMASIVAGMPRHIEYRNGIHWVPNPVNPKENFADKWREHPDRADKFFEWIKRVQQDLAGALDLHGVNKVFEQLANSLGGQTIKRAAKGYGDSMLAIRKKGALAVSTSTGMLGAISTPGAIPVKEHTFYGGQE